MCASAEMGVGSHRIRAGSAPLAGGGALVGTQVKAGVGSCYAHMTVASADAGVGSGYSILPRFTACACGGRYPRRGESQ